MTAPATAAEFNAAVVEVFEVRRMVAGDLAFVRDSWARSAWKREEAKLKADGMGRRGRERSRHPFYEMVRPHITERLEDSGVVVLVACAREDRGHIGGWVAVRNDDEDRCELASYVKADYRPWGVAEMLKRAMEAL